MRYCSRRRVRRKPEYLRGLRKRVRFGPCSGGYAVSARRCARLAGALPRMSAIFCRGPSRGCAIHAVGPTKPAPPPRPATLNQVSEAAPLQGKASRSAPTTPCLPRPTRSWPLPGTRRGHRSRLAKQESQAGSSRGELAQGCRRPPLQHQPGGRSHPKLQGGTQPDPRPCSAATCDMTHGCAALFGQLLPTPGPPNNGLALWEADRRGLRGAILPAASPLV